MFAISFQIVQLSLDTREETTLLERAFTTRSRSTEALSGTQDSSPESLDVFTRSFKAVKFGPHTHETQPYIALSKGP